MVDGIAALGAFFIIYLIVMIGLYIFVSFAFMKIGKKAQLKSPGIAWIPGIGPLLIAFFASGMHWWPWLLLIGFIIPFLNIVVMLVFMVFAIIWYWKMFEAIGKPGWWAIMLIIPIVNIIFIAIAAWSE
jgi:uncharacterized membrane protein YhaH (DUF805 family)